MKVKEHLNYLINNEYLTAVELVTTDADEKYVTVHFGHKAGAVLYCEFFGLDDSVKSRLTNLMQPDGAVYLTLNFSKLFKVYNDKGYEVDGLNIDRSTLDVVNTKKYKWINDKEIRCTASNNSISQYFIVNNVWYDIPDGLSNYVQTAIGFNNKRYLVVRKEALRYLADMIEEYCGAN